jgi:hypothetical protein
VVFAWERRTVAAVTCSLCPGKGEKAGFNPAFVDGVQAVFVNGLQDKFFFKISTGNKLRILKIDLILFVKAVTYQPACGPALYKAVAARIVGNNSAVSRRAKIIRPGSRRIQPVYNIFPFFRIKITVLYDKSSI